MPTNYTPSPTAVQAPSIAPESEGTMTVVLPSDGDNANVASIAQALKVIADWTTWAVRPTAISTEYDKPVQRWANARGQKRFTVDHLGLPGGQIGTHCEHFATDAYEGPIGYLGRMIPGTLGWSYAGDGTVSGYTSNPVDEIFPGGPLLLVNVGHTVNDYAAITHPPFCVGSDNVAFAFEFALGVLGPHADVDLTFGLGNGIIPFSRSYGVTDRDAHLALPAGGIFIRKGAADTHWQIRCTTLGGSTTTVVGPLIVAAQIDQFRIEWHGANVADDATARLNVIINGTTFEFTTGLPHEGGAPGDCWRSSPYFSAKRVANTSFAGLTLGGPVRFAHSIYPNP